MWATSRDASHRLQPPCVTIVNPIGCGDCLTAGLADALARNVPFVEALQWGVAVAAANAERLLPADFARDRVRELSANIPLQSERRHSSR